MGTTFEKLMSPAVLARTMRAYGLPLRAAPEKPEADKAEGVRDFEIEVDYRATATVKVQANTLAEAHRKAAKAAEDLPNFVWVNETTTVRESELQEGQQENGKE